MGGVIIYHMIKVIRSTLLATKQEALNHTQAALTDRQTDRHTQILDKRVRGHTRVHTS